MSIGYAGVGTPGAAVVSNPTTIYSGEQTVTEAAVALATNQALVNGAVLKSLQTNTGTVYVGNSGVTTGNGYELAPGEAISYACTNFDEIYIIGTNLTDVVVFTGN